MARVAYLDCPAGISGDMCLGALVDAGVPLTYLQAVVAQLGLGSNVALEATKTWRCGQVATKVHVITPQPVPLHSGHGHHRHLPEIEAIICQGNFDPIIETWSLNTFRHLAAAEGAVHGISPDAVHFHEVGALDAIVDIVATCAGLAWLGVEKIFCSALPTGGGYVRCDHGLMPVPAPATLKLYQQHQVPIFSNGIERELVTPTGAALAVTLSEGFGTVPKFQITDVGIGAGSHDLPIPNILRLWVGVLASGQINLGAAGSGDSVRAKPQATQEIPDHHFHNGHDTGHDHASSHGEHQSHSHNHSNNHSHNHNHDHSHEHSHGHDAMHHHESIISEPIELKKTAILHH